LAGGRSSSFPRIVPEPGRKNVRKYKFPPRSLCGPFAQTTLALFVLERVLSCLACCFFHANRLEYRCPSSPPFHACWVSRFRGCRSILRILIVLRVVPGGFFSVQLRSQSPSRVRRSLGRASLYLSLERDGIGKFTGDDGQIEDFTSSSG